MTSRLQRMNCIRTSARVVSIQETEKNVVVTTTSGEAYTGDIVIGADGVRSAVRRHIDVSLSNKPSDECEIPLQYANTFANCYRH
jgi:2-polyprenyl-6-methoxyphenol hydroxylase-like FAD-dependent oxidoreductase